MHIDGVQQIVATEGQMVLCCLIAQPALPVYVI